MVVKGNAAYGKLYEISTTVFTKIFTADKISLDSHPNSPHPCSRREPSRCLKPSAATSRRLLALPNATECPTAFLSANTTEETNEIPIAIPQLHWHRYRLKIARFCSNYSPHFMLLIPHRCIFFRYYRSTKTIQLDNLQLIDQTLKIADNDYGSFSSSLLSGKL